MKLIGAGMPRTATLTEKIALEMLGLGPCYHMVDVLADLGQAQFRLDLEAPDIKSIWLPPLGRSPRAAWSHSLPSVVRQGLGG